MMASRKATRYLLSLPERAVRSLAGLAAGLVREVSEVSLPSALRRTRLYRNLVDTTLRFLIEQVGQVEGSYPDGERLAADFALRRTAGNGIEIAGILAFRASPVWVMAAMADVTGAGRHLIREISAALADQGLLEPGSRFDTVDQMLDGLERTSSRLADTISTPPLDVGALRGEWQAIRRDAASIHAPAIESLDRLWVEMKAEAASQGRSVFELSSVMALSAFRGTPETLRWLTQGASVAARRTGEIMGIVLLGHYRQALKEIHEEGFVRYWTREFQPYLHAAARQFSPDRESLTERWLK
jgi:hypothetical protein